MALGLLAAGIPAAAVAAPPARTADLVTPAVASGALFGVAATSANGAWAVGQSGTSTLKTLVVHWNGTAWRRVPSPSPGSGNDVLNAVAATSAASAWAVGGQNGQPLILHWNGTAWVQQASQSVISAGPCLKNVPAVYVSGGVARMVALAICTTLAAIRDAAAARSM